MQVGDLVKPGEMHGLRGMDHRAHGLVIAYHQKTDGFKEAVTVRWNSGDIELEIPSWLEVINESR